MRSMVEGPLRQPSGLPPPPELRSQGGIMSLDPLPADQLAAVVTYLEMTGPPTEPVPSTSLQIRRIRPTADDYRALFR